MFKNIDYLIGMASLLSVSFADLLQQYTSIICMTIITITTCVIQVYRMIRDRDKDKDGDK